MSLDLMLEGGALALAMWAAVRSLPRPPALDWERLFKVSLATVVRGRVADAGGDAAMWESAVVGTVLYHPAGRAPEDKLSSPDPAALPTPALPGERGLVEALAGVPAGAARWRRLWVEDEAMLDALLGDPEELGADYDVARVTAPGLDWEAVAGWSTPLQAALGRRASHLRVVGADAAWVDAVAAQVPGVRGHTVDPSTASDPQALALALGEAVSDPSDRLVVVLTPPHGVALLAALGASPVLRDHVVAVVALGADLRTDGGAFLDAAFTQEAMDTELNRVTPYLSVIAVDGPDDAGPAWARQRFPDPPVPPTGRRAVQPIDLGPLRLHALPPAEVARAMWIVLAFWLAG